MPTYDYACTHCDHSFEVVQAFTDDALTECPECGGRLRKVFGSVGVVFKGSGFYRTDSRASSAIPSGSSENKSSEGKSSQSKTASTSADGTSGSSSSTKPAASTSSSGSSGSTSSSSGSTSAA